MSRHKAIKYKEHKGYDYITSFISCGKLFYEFHGKKDGIVKERLTLKQLEEKIKRCKI
jgi:hypothetical protein